MDHTMTAECNRDRAIWARAAAYNDPRNRPAWMSTREEQEQER